MGNEQTLANGGAHRGKIGQRVAYAFGNLGQSAFYNALSTYFIVYVTSCLFSGVEKGVAAKLIGVITSLVVIIRIAEIFIDPLLGNIVDNTTTKWGKFKPWVVGGGVVSSVALMVLFTDMGGLNETNPMLYLAIFAVLYIVMDIFYSFKDISFWSMVPALTFSSEEREKTATFARVGSTIGGNIVGVVIMPIVLFFSVTKSGSGDKNGWFWFAFIVALIGIISVICVALGTHEVDSTLRQNKTKTGFKDVFRMLLKNDQLMAIALSYLAYTTGVAILNASELYYFQYILGDASKFSILATINTLVGLVSVSLFPKLAQQFSRRNVFVVCLGIMLAGIVLFFFAGKSLALVLVAAELFFIPQPLVFLVVLMTITDCVEYGQLKLGHRDEALTLSVRPLLDKFGGAVSNWVIGFAAVAAGMTAGSENHVSAQGEMNFKLIVFVAPLVLIVIGLLIFLTRVKLTEEKHAEIVAELEKTWGKDALGANASAEDEATIASATEEAGSTPTK